MIKTFNKIQYCPLDSQDVVRGMATIHQHKYIISLPKITQKLPRIHQKIVHDLKGILLGNSMLACGSRGYSKNQACDCRVVQQTANHIITKYSLYHPPNSLHGLIDIDIDAATHE